MVLSALLYIERSLPGPFLVSTGGAQDYIVDWYPGDEYVDWLGRSWFMPPDQEPGVEPGFDVPTPGHFGDDILELARQAGNPMLIAEAEPQSHDLRDGTTAHHSSIQDGPAGEEVTSMSDDAIQDARFQPIFDYMNENANVIRGLAYIDVRWDDQQMWGAPYASGYWGNTRVEANAYIASRFTDAIKEWRSGNE